MRGARSSTHPLTRGLCVGAQLPAHEKHLTLDKVNYFNGAVVRANLLRPQGPAYLLDMHHITQGTAEGT
jgi:hypothetical protein